MPTKLPHVQAPSLVGSCPGGEGATARPDRCGALGTRTRVEQPRLTDYDTALGMAGGLMPGWTRTTTKTSTATEDFTAELSFLTRALKALSLREFAERLPERACAENWTREEFLIACLQRDESSRRVRGLHLLRKDEVREFEEVPAGVA
ncbi:hypothetical protein [Nocardia gipuzkoensis]